MAIAKVADRATVNGNAAITTADFVLSGLTVDNVLIISGGADNSGSSGAARTVTVTNQSGTPIDLATDVAFQRNNDPGAASAGVTANAIVARITATSGTVRVTYSGTVVQAMVAEEWSGVNNTTFVVGTPVGADGVASTNLASCADASVASGNVAYGVIAAEGPSTDTYTQDADTSNRSWVSLTKAGTANATADTNITRFGGYKIVTAAGAQTYNPTVSVARDSAGLILELAQLVRTATSAQTLPSFTQSATGTHVAPTWTATASQTLPAVTQAATGTAAPPTSTATASQTLPSVTQSATGTHVRPVYTGTAAQTLAAFTQAATGTHAGPVFTGTASQTLASIGQAATGTHVGPVFSGTSTQTLPSFSQTATGTHVRPTYTATATSGLAAITQAATASHTPPVYTATSSQTLPPAGQSATGEVFAPVYSGEVVQILPAFGQSATGTFTARPVFTGTGSQTLPALDQQAAGAFSEQPDVPDPYPIRITYVEPSTAVSVTTGSYAVTSSARFAISHQEHA